MMLLSLLSSLLLLCMKVCYSVGADKVVVGDGVITIAMLILLLL